jgi:hypothetical protein
MGVWPMQLRHEGRIVLLTTTATIISLDHFCTALIHTEWFTAIGVGSRMLWSAVTPSRLVHSKGITNLGISTPEPLPEPVRSLS